MGSKVLFIATANQLNNIPSPLRDRMEVIDVPSYTSMEKINISKRYLIPKQIEAHGLLNRKIKFTDKAILNIAVNYTREAGVRNLEREIACVCRKITVKLLHAIKKQKAFNTLTVKKSSLRKLLGPEKFSKENITYK